MEILVCNAMMDTYLFQESVMSKILSAKKLIQQMGDALNVGKVMF